MSVAGRPGVRSRGRTLGVLAKESSILSLASGGRFELGIGAGDYPVEYSA